MCKEQFRPSFDALKRPSTGPFPDGAGHISGLFVGDLAGIRIGAALHVRWAGFAGVFQSLVLSDALTRRFAVRIRIIAAEMLEWFTSGQMRWLFLGSHSKSTRLQVPSVRPP